MSWTLPLRPGAICCSSRAISTARREEQGDPAPCSAGSRLADLCGLRAGAGSAAAHRRQRHRRGRDQRDPRPRADRHGGRRLRKPRHRPCPDHVSPRQGLSPLGFGSTPVHGNDRLQQRLIGYRQALADAARPIPGQSRDRGADPTPAGGAEAVAVLSRRDAALDVSFCSRTRARHRRRAGMPPAAAGRAPCRLAIAGYGDVDRRQQVTTAAGHGCASTAVAWAARRRAVHPSAEGRDWPPRVAGRGGFGIVERDSAACPRRRIVSPSAAAPAASPLPSAPRTSQIGVGTHRDRPALPLRSASIPEALRVGSERWPFAGSIDGANSRDRGPRLVEGVAKCSWIRKFGTAAAAGEC